MPGIKKSTRYHRGSKCKKRLLPWSWASEGRGWSYSILEASEGTWKLKLWHLALVSEHQGDHPWTWARLSKEMVPGQCWGLWEGCNKVGPPSVGKTTNWQDLLLQEEIPVLRRAVWLGWHRKWKQTRKWKETNRKEHSCLSLLQNCVFL